MALWAYVAFFALLGLVNPGPLDAFSVAVHRQVDVDTLTDDLTSVLARTLQPATVELWLRRPSPTPHGS